MVTATRAKESIQKIGIAVSAFTGAALESKGISDTGDLGQITPGLIVAKAGGSELTGLVSIRGVSQNDFTAHLESPNALYIDDYYQPSAANGVQQFYDVERIEVLKGPQGTLFGRNATGGLLNVFTREPENHFEGYVTGTLADYDEMGLKGAVSIPVSDRVLTRWAFLRTKHDGYYKNVLANGRDLNGGDVTAMRGKVNIAATDDLQINLVGDYYYSNYKGTGGMFAVPAAVDPETGLGYNLPRDTPRPFSGLPAGKPFETAANFAGGYYRKTWSVGAKVEYALDDILITSLSNYSEVVSRYDEDNDQTPADIGTFSQYPKNENFSKELRIHKDDGSFRWSTGIYYLDVRGKYHNGFDFIVADADLAVDYDIDGQSYSLFGQASQDLGEKFTLTAGARVVHDKKDYLQVWSCSAANPATSACAAFGGPGTIGSLSPLTNKHDETGWTGRLQLDYKPTDDVLLYASVNRGYKSFNYNANFAGNVPVDALVLKPEVLLAKEIGAKTQFLDGMMRLNAAAFHYDYSDFHAFDQRGLNFTLFNADAEIYGAEAELTFSPGGGFTGNIAGTYLHARAFDVPIANRLLTRHITQSPRYTFMGSIQKTFELAPGTLTAQVDGVYYDKQYAQISNAPNTQISAYGTANARLSFRPRTADVDVAVFARNVFDSHHPNYAFDLAIAGYTELDLTNPRILGVEVTLGF